MALSRVAVPRSPSPIGAAAARLRDLDWILLAFLLAVVLAGGSSRADSLAQPLVRLAAVLAMAGWWWRGWPLDLASVRLPLALVGFGAAAVLIQLIPLPPAMWGALPGRELYTTTDVVAGIGPQWRPAALVPARAWSAFFSLLVPLATLVGLAQLSARRRAALAPLLLLVALASATLGLAQVLGGSTGLLRWYALSSSYSGTGFFANRNHQALLLAMALPVAGAWVAVPGLNERQRRWRSWSALGIAAFLIMALPTTGSRAGLLLGAVGAVMGLVIAGGALRRRLAALPRVRRRGWIAAGILAIVALVAVLLLFGRNEALTRLLDLDATQDLRARTLPTVLDLTRQFFPVGSGLGSFDTVFRRAEPFHLLKFTYFNQAHNDWVSTLLEGGVPAALVLLAATAWWGWASWRAWRTPTSEAALAARAGSVVIGLVMAASLTDYPARTPLIMALVAVAAAWLADPHGRAVSARAAAGRRGAQRGDQV